MTKALVAVAAFALLLSPLAQAHASPNPLNVDQHLLADDSTDAYLAYDGFDLQDLYVREGYVNDANGLIFRMVIYGGFGPVTAASQLHLDISMDAGAGAQTFRVSTNDGLAWTSDVATIMESSLEEDEGAIAGALQVFVPLSAIGANINDTVGSFVWKNFADADLRDIAPGGHPVPGTNGAAILEATSTVKKESITLQGPQGYTSTTIKRTGDAFELAVENLITPVGQHIMLFLPDAPGWSIDRTDTNAKVVEVGQHPTFAFTATSDEGAKPFNIEVLSDLGGREVLTIVPLAEDPAAPAPGSTNTPTGGEKESPGGLWLAPMALLAAIALRRR